MERVLYDADGWPIKRFHTAPGEDGWAIETIQDVEPILDDNARFRNDGDGYSPSRELRKVASVPVVEFINMCHEDGLLVVDVMGWPRRQFADWMLGKIRQPDRKHLATVDKI